MVAKRYYLDTSALVKRYVLERGSDVVDRVFAEAHAKKSSIALSLWNVGEAAVVFDKYGRRIGLDPKKTMRLMLSELRTLSLIHSLVVVRVSHRAVLRSAKVALRHGIYVADALQIVSCEISKSTELLTADRELYEVAVSEGVSAKLLG